MNFTLINMDTYERKEHFYHYKNINNCSYSLTYSIDVTNLIEKCKKYNYKFYPTFIYIVSKSINSIKEFRMTLDDNGNLGFYDEVSASYLIFHKDDKTFSSAYTKYNSNFKIFYTNIIKDMEKYKDVKGFEVIKSPKNTFPVSCLPWINYTGFNLNIPNEINFYAPIITWGQYIIKEDKLEMPITIQINHAVADGYHTSMLLKKIEHLCNNLL